jgi:hypothetical protein
VKARPRGSSRTSCPCSNSTSTSLARIIPAHLLRRFPNRVQIARRFASAGIGGQSAGSAFGAPGAEMVRFPACFRDCRVGSIPPPPPFDSLRPFMAGHSDGRRELAQRVFLRAENGTAAPWREGCMAVTEGGPVTFFA